MQLADQATDIIRELIKIPSESSQPTGSDQEQPEGRVVRYLAGLFKQSAIDYAIQPVNGPRSNIIAHFPRANAHKILITGHMDTVSAAGMKNPFSASIADGHILGRGACDDKGPLGCALAVLLNLHRAKRLCYDVRFAATVDEECTMSGAEKLASAYSKWDLCIGLEPTGLRIVKAHKGLYRCRITTRGVAAHSSAPEKGKNAINLMLPIMSDLLRQEIFFKRKPDPELGRGIISLTQIEGGTSINIIPDSCSVSVDVRLLPRHTPEQVAAMIRRVVYNRAQVEELFAASALSTSMDNPLIAMFQQAVAGEKINPEGITAAYATDCSRLAVHGPCIIWGPGDIADAHQIQEKIDTAQIKAGCRILECFLSTPPSAK